MVFYPDNVKRATRLQQLVDTTAVLQNACQRSKTDIDEANAKMSALITPVLNAGGFDSPEQLFAKAMAEMTDEQKAQFEALIEAVKKANAGFDISYWVAGAMMGPQGLIKSWTTITSIVRFATRVVAVYQATVILRTAQSGATAAATAVQAISKAASEAENGMKELVLAGDAAKEVKLAANVLGKVRFLCKALGNLGFVLSLVSGVAEAIQGAQQKAQLIDDIHQLQPTRLVIAYFQREAERVIQNLNSVKDYVDSLPGGSRPWPAGTAHLQETLLLNLTQANSTITFEGLETDLESQDRQSGNFYGDDDLPFADVVRIAQADPDVAPTPPPPSPPASPETPESISTAVNVALQQMDNAIVKAQAAFEAAKAISFAATIDAGVNLSYLTTMRATLEGARGRLMAQGGPDVTSAPGTPRASPQAILGAIDVALQQVDNAIPKAQADLQTAKNTHIAEVIVNAAQALDQLTRAKATLQVVRGQVATAVVFGGAIAQM